MVLGKSSKIARCILRQKWKVISTTRSVQVKTAYLVAKAHLIETASRWCKATKHVYILITITPKDHRWNISDLENRKDSSGNFLLATLIHLSNTYQTYSMYQVLCCVPYRCVISLNLHNNPETGTIKCPHFKSKKLEMLQKVLEVWEVVEPGFKFGTPRLKKCFVKNYNTQLNYIKSILKIWFCSLFTMDIFKCVVTSCLIGQTL